MGWLTRRKKTTTLDQWDLSVPLLRWTPEAPWTIGDSFMGTQILGSTGSGKTSGSMAAICMAMLRAGYGGLFLTAKREDCATYTRYLNKAGRGSDLRVFSPDHPLRYNFIADEQARSSGPTGLAENLAALVMTASELGDRGSGGGHGDNERYFRLEATRLARNGLLILALAGEPITVPALHMLIVSAPQSPEQVSSEGWQKSSFCFQKLRLADKAPKNPSQQADYELALTYLLHEWPALSSRTRSVVQSTLTSTTDLLSRGAARDMLSSPSPNISPADCYDGAIVIADFPVLVYKDVGQLIQVILKYAWQRSHAARVVTGNTRPTFIVADESQLFLVRADHEFQAIARSTRTAVVCATQSISGMMDAMGSHSEHAVHSLLTNQQTRVCHQQTDIRTVEYMQSLIGRSRQLLMNSSQQQSGWLSPLFASEASGSAGFSETWEHELNARDLNGLARGGPPHFYTEAIVYQGGRAFADGRTWARVVIPQYRD